MDLKKIGTFIAECRKEQNLTQSQLAEKLNMSNKSVSKWETGKGMPDTSIMLELCDYLHINVNELLSGEHLKEEEYKSKVNENIMLVVKESEKDKRQKKLLLFGIGLICLGLILYMIIRSIYSNAEFYVKYDERLIKSELTEDTIRIVFNGSSLVGLSTEKINYQDETLIFVNGKMLLQNKINSHYEAWDSMAYLYDGKIPPYSSQIYINIKDDIEDCKDKIKVYYTTISLAEIRKNYKNKLPKILKNSELILEK